MSLTGEADIFSYFHNSVVERVIRSMGAIQIPETLLSKIIVGPPTQRQHGDIYTNAALILAKFGKKNPMEFAKSLCREFEGIDGVESASVAEPGFINLRCYPHVWHGVIRNINILGSRYGITNLGNGKKVNVEFVSANPTGPLHIGHARGAVFGDVLSNLLKYVGYDVTREYYVNDAGGQIDALISSAILRYQEAIGEENVTIGDGLYPGEYLKPVANALVEKYGRDLLRREDRYEVVRNFALNNLLDLIKADLDLLGVRHDVFVSEKALQNEKVIEKCIEYLRERGLVYEGFLDKPKGVEDGVEWHSRKQMLFKSTDFGDDSDRALQKSDGSWTYFAGDIAYHFNKLSRGFDRLILALGFDHKGYVSRIKAIVNALSDGNATIDVKLYNMVNFLENGVPVKMSKRKGEFLTVRDVVDAVGRDVTRFMMLTRKNDVVLDFDFAKAREESKDSQLFYIQYAHARVKSVERNCRELLPLEDTDFHRVSSDNELSLAKLLAVWPRIVKSAAANCEPHNIAFYLVEVAEAFHTIWGQGNKNADMRFIIYGDKQTTSARIYLARAAAAVISSGLSIFSIVPVDEMH